MGNTAKMLAKLGPKVARIPMGEKRAAAGLPQADKSLRTVRKALELRTVGGVEPLTRVHGSQTQSMDYDQLTPQDVAAALGFIRDPHPSRAFLDGAPTTFDFVFRVIKYRDAQAVDLAA